MCKVPNIPSKLLNADLGSPTDPKNILYFYVRKLVSKSQNRLYLNKPCDSPLFQFYTHAKAASLIFGNGITYKQYLTRMLSAYKSMFEIQGNFPNVSFRPNLQMLFQHHPRIFSEADSQSQGDIKAEMITALHDEIRASYQQRDKNLIFLSGITESGTSGNDIVYQAICEVEEDDAVIQLPEGLMVDYKSGDFKQQVTILEYDNRYNTVVFLSPGRLRILSHPYLINDPSYLLRNQIKRLENGGFETSPFLHLFESRVVPRKLDWNHRILEQKADETQVAAISKSLQSQITYIWGPPGTGKSFSLSVLLTNFLSQQQRTLVCAIANVAVDGLAMALVDAVRTYQRDTGMDVLKRGDILRIGFVRNPELKKINELFPEDDEISSLRTRLEMLEAKKSRLPVKSQLYNENLAAIESCRKSIQARLKEKIEKAKIILCTSSKALIDPSISESVFENLVIDEGSMMAPPALAGLCQNVKSRIVVAGDFRQLGPIAVGQTDLVNRWLHRSLFDLLGKDPDAIKAHQYIAMIKKQRRCAKDIIELVNKEYYDNFLFTSFTPDHDTLKKVAPGTKNVAFIDATIRPDYYVHRTKSASRQNPGSGQTILNLIFSWRNLPIPGNVSIGIITPYRGQVSFYTKALREQESRLHPNIRGKIRVGTIHTFQGSECDLIIFDMVEALKDHKGNSIQIGRLYHGRSGEQLLNVAISRAKSKLIIVGCKTVLLEGQYKDQVKMSVKRIINQAATYF